jgi:hypothetical protein
MININISTYQRNAREIFSIYTPLPQRPNFAMSVHISPARSSDYTEIFNLAEVTAALKDNKK